MQILGFIFHYCNFLAKKLAKKIPLMKQIAQNLPKANLSDEINSQKITVAAYLANAKFG